MLDNIHEQIRIAEATGVTTVATHLKARGVRYWGKSAEILEALESARKRGVPIYADQYPYNTSGSDGSITLLPDWIARTYGETTGKKLRDIQSLYQVDELFIVTAINDFPKRLHSYELLSEVFTQGRGS